MSLHEACSGPAALVPDALRGYRSWAGLEVTASGEVHLASTGVPYFWRAGELTAGCMTPRPPWSLTSLTGCSCALCRSYQPGDLPQDPRHVAPVPDCTCGFYGWYRPEDIRIVPAPIRGVIEASGRVLLGTHGFRAERARLVAITIDPVQSSRYHDVRELVGGPLGEAGVQVFPDLTSLAAEFPPEDLTGLIDHTCDERCDDIAGSRQISMAVPPAVAARIQRDALAIAFQQTATALYSQLAKALYSRPPSTESQGSQDPYEKALESRRTRGTGPGERRTWWLR